MRILLLVWFICSHLNAAQNSADDVKIKMCETLPSILGWCSREKALEFFDLVLQVKPEVCVEVGVFGGASLFPVATALKFLHKGQIIGIDPWDRLECIKYFDPIEDQAQLAWWGKVDMLQVHYSCLSILSRHGLNDLCITIKATSKAAASFVPGPIDILHLDGNHSECMTLEDVRLYLPKVREGGYIWLNDTLWNSIQPAIDLLSECCDVIKLIDSGNCILFKKRARSL